MSSSLQGKKDTHANFRTPDNIYLGKKKNAKIIIICCFKRIFLNTELQFWLRPLKHLNREGRLDMTQKQNSTLRLV
ncbi:hypothetical protein HYPGJ_30671 [Hyphomicrobium sp. GJ21]|nr:hypothetical protein HYPGJ_30671 [Hyphomicrobium sp. GJ21]